MKKLLTLAFLLNSANLFAQQTVETADAMRANGKIYVVVGVVFIVLIGMLGYLFQLDRKITRLEKSIKP